VLPTANQILQEENLAGLAALDRELITRAEASIHLDG
jgi:hypothetical protein